MLRPALAAAPVGMGGGFGARRGDFMSYIAVFLIVLVLALGVTARS